MNTLKALVLAAAMLFLPVAAHAQPAYTAGTVSLHAGPAADYPVVAVVQGGLSVSVHGCTPDYRWCDVVAGGYRGWLHARDIDYFYQGARVPLIDYGAVVGIGVVTFIIGNYWQQHYTARHWYPQLPHWSRRPPHTDFHSRPAQAARPAPWLHPAPAFRPSVQPSFRPSVAPPRADTHHRPREAAPRPRYQHSAAPAARPQQRGADARAHSQPGRSEARTGNPQRSTSGPTRGTHLR